MDIFFILFYQPAYNLLLTAYSFSQNGFGLLLGIIVIGVIVRLIMFPMVKKQLTMVRQNTDLQQRMKEIKEKYKDDKEKMQEEMLQLNKEVMPSIVSGCLPLILQLIIFISIDRVIRDLFNPEQGIAAFQPHLYNQNLLAGSTVVDSGLGIMNIASIPSTILQEGTIINFLPYFTIILLTAAAQYFSLKLSLSYSKKRKLKLQQESEKKKKKNKKSENKAEEDFAEILAKTTEQTMLLFPLLLVIGALAFPMGLTIYWLVQSSLGVLQQLYFIKILDKADTNVQTNTSKQENNLV